MKKIIALILLLSLSVFALASCKKEDTTTLSVGFLTGPTGLGMAKLINDNGGVAGNDKYTFKNYADNVNLALSDISAGNVDLVCVPTNNVAAYIIPMGSFSGTERFDELLNLLKGINKEIKYYK